MINCAVTSGQLAPPKPPVRITTAAGDDYSRHSHIAVLLAQILSPGVRLRETLAIRLAVMRKNP